MECLFCSEIPTKKLTLCNCKKMFLISFNAFLTKLSVHKLAFLETLWNRNHIIFSSAAFFLTTSDFGMWIAFTFAIAAFTTDALQFGDGWGIQAVFYNTQAMCTKYCLKWAEASFLSCPLFCKWNLVYKQITACSNFQLLHN